MNWYKKAQQTKLVFENIHKDYAYGQNDFMLLAKLADTLQPVGGIDYSEYQGVLAIQYVLVKPEFQRQGIATELVKELNRLNKTEFEGKPIQWGLLTDKGNYLYQSLKHHELV